MRVRASSIDRGLSQVLLNGRVAGTTLAVYDRAAYLQSREGSLLILAQMSVGGGPGFILLRHEYSLKNGRPSFRPGERFEGEKGMVTIGDGRIIIEVGDADRWDPFFVPAGTRRLDELEACVTISREAARSRGIGSGLAPLLDGIGEFCEAARPARRGNVAHCGRTVCEKVRALADALACGRGAGARAAARGIVGLGEGLTPSCDDMLVGMAGFFCGARRIPSLEAYGRRTLTWLGEAMASASAETSPVSGHFLREAARGRFTERVKELMDGIFSADQKRVERAAQRVLEYGATSGIDLIFGLALGYEIARRRSRLLEIKPAEGPGRGPRETGHGGKS